MSDQQSATAAYPLSPIPGRSYGRDSCAQRRVLAVISADPEPVVFYEVGYRNPGRGWTMLSDWNGWPGSQEPLEHD